MAGFSSLPDILLILCCALVFYQDLRDRAVSLLLLIGCLVLAGVKYGSADIGYIPLLINCLFVLVQLLVVLLYCRFKFHSYNIFRFMGAGDLMCWGVLVMLFSPLNFVVFFVLSLLGSFLLYVLLIKVQHNSNYRNIPLAGFQSLLVIFVLLVGLFKPSWQPYDDFNLLILVGLV